MAQDGATSNRAHARSCEKADCASLTWICGVEQLYTNAALVLYTDASRRVAVTARSGVLDVHVHGGVKPILCTYSKQRRPSPSERNCSSSRGRFWMPCGVQARARLKTDNA